MRPKSLVEAAGRILAGEAREIALDEFLDEFYLCQDSARREEMIAAEPPFTANAWQDAYIAAIGEHLARRWELAIPPWVDNPRRFLHRPHFAENFQLSKPVFLRDSPIAFRRRLIFTEAEPLRRATMPRATTPRDR